MDAIIMIMLTVGSSCGAKGLCQYVTQPIITPDPHVTMMSAPRARPVMDVPSAELPGSLREAEGGAVTCHP